MQLEPETYLLYNLGLAFLAEEHEEQGRAAFALALEQSPDYHPCHRALASWLESRGRAEEAATEWARVLELVPGDAEATTALARLTTR